MAFAGKVYWVADGQDVIACWDSTTSNLSWVYAGQPDLLGGSFGSDYGYFGTLTLLGDGRIMSRLGDDVDAWAIVFDPDLSAASAELWSAPSKGSSAVAYDGAIGVYDPATGLNWMYRSDHDSRFDDAHWWLGYDNAGSLVDARAAYDSTWFFTWPAGEQSYGNAVLNGSVLYRNIDQFNNVDRYNLSTGAWDRANGFTTGSVRSLCPAGVYAGAVVWVVYRAFSEDPELVTVDDSAGWVPMASGAFNPNMGDQPVLSTWHPTGMDASDESGPIRINGSNAVYIHDGGDTFVIRNLDLASDTVTDLFSFTETYINLDGSESTPDGDWWTSLYGSGFGYVLVPGGSPGKYPLRRYPPVGNGGHGPTRHWPRTVNRRAGKSY